MTSSIVSYQASSWYWRLNGPLRYQHFFLKRIRLFHWTMFVLHTLSPTYQSQAPLGFNIGSPWPAACCCCCSNFLTHIVSISKVNYIIGVLFNVFLWKKTPSWTCILINWKKFGNSEWHKKVLVVFDSFDAQMSLMLYLKKKGKHKEHTKQIKIRGCL